MKDEITKLANKAATVLTSLEALQYSQAALNLANALITLTENDKVAKAQ